MQPLALWPPTSQHLSERSLIDSSKCSDICTQARPVLNNLPSPYQKAGYVTRSPITVLTEAKYHNSPVILKSNWTTGQ